MHTIFVRFANKKERDHMLAFVQAFDWSGLYTSEQTTCTPLVDGEQLGFAPAKGRTIIGAKGTDFPQWAWAVCAWMAQKSSQRVNDWAVVHHDEEEIPVVVGNKSCGNDVLVVDKNYRLLAWRDNVLPQGPDHVRQMDFIDALNAAWVATKPRTKA